MPVEGNEVHDGVRRSRPIAGCSNLPEMKDGYYATERHYFPDGTYALRLVFIAHRMSKLCRGAFGEYINGQWKELDECRECKRPRDTEYIEHARRLNDAQRTPSA